MNNSAKILDCTLRDGAYIVDKYFGAPTIHGIVNGLVNAKIDYIEIGFLQNDGFGDGKTVYLNSKDAEEYVPYCKGNSLFTVLADYSRYSFDNLDQYTGKSFDAVRVCFFKHERYLAQEAFKAVKEKGYKLFIQPVDVLGYTDEELIELINLVNPLEPYCFSLVDTFGSMYMEDLHRQFLLVNHNLISTCGIGFHSHNNLQMSNALSQEFIKLSSNRVLSVIDTSISGMGRGAGNTPTELVAQFMVSRLNCSYDIDSILDIIDSYMDNIKTRCSWGYNTPYFIAGSYSAHVNNIAYLTKRSTIHSKDIRYILNKIGSQNRKRYDYDLLEKTYMQYLESDINDTDALKTLANALAYKCVVLIAPGISSSDYAKEINAYIEKTSAIAISVNFLPKNININYIYFSNARRYDYWKNSSGIQTTPLILTSNIEADDSNNIIVSFNRLVKCGWENMDNSMIMLLRLMDILPVASIAIAGFDGFGYNSARNYAMPCLELSNVYEAPDKINDDISNMLEDYILCRNNKCPISFITESRFSNILNKANRDNND